jgi:hypothetical protein
MSTLFRVEIGERRKATETITPASADPGTFKKRTWSPRKGEVEEEGIERKLPPSEMKE